MTKKDYTNIEDAIQRFLSINPELERYANKLVHIFSKMLMEDNPKFDEQKFMSRYKRNTQH